jgi:hypothetical protein
VRDDVALMGRRSVLSSSALMLTLAIGCTTAEIDPVAAAGTDAGGADSSAPGAVIFEDDFETGSLDERWESINAGMSQSGGLLVSGESCSEEEASCTLGPAILCTRASFPVLGGVISIEYDFSVEGSTAGESRSRVWLQNAAMSLDYSPARVFTDRDLLLEVLADTSGTTSFVATWAVDRGPDAVRFGDLLGSVTPSTWHHARVHTCAVDGGSARVARGRDSSSSDHPTALDLPTMPPIDAFHVCVVADGMAHRFDRLVVTRGCLGPRP